MKRRKNYADEKKKKLEWMIEDWKQRGIKKTHKEYGNKVWNRKCGDTQINRERTKNARPDAQGMEYGTKKQVENKE